MTQQSKKERGSEGEEVKPVKDTTTPFSKFEVRSSKVDGEEKEMKQLSISHKIKQLEGLCSTCMIKCMIQVHVHRDI